MAQPFFTIGIPTYNRHDLLRETLESVISQEFDDFEIIVGNDYTAEVLTGEMLGVSDPRIRFVNYPANLREVGNMNALLEMATGRYFTWLFDDDLHEPGYLQTAHDCLVRTGFPPALFPSFRMLKVAEQFRPRNVRPDSVTELTGREFLRRYSAERPEIASTFGMFDTAMLKSIVGGVEELCDCAIGIYCEYLFLVKCALLDRIVYINAPFYVFRRHEESASETNVNVGSYIAAGQELLTRCGAILHHPGWGDDFSANLKKFCKIHIITLAYVVSRFEFAQKKFGIGTVCRALSRHWKESGRTEELYARLGGDTGPRNRLVFLRTKIYCSYIILRLLAHFSNRSLR